MRKLSVSIVTYNTQLDELRKCLISLDTPEIDTIYIVDNSNQPYLADFCTQYEKIVYMPGENVGYGAGHNKAIRKSLVNGVAYHLVLNSDVGFEPTVLTHILDYMDSHTDVAQVQPRIIYPDGQLQYSVRMLPTPIDLIMRRFMPSCVARSINYRYLLQFANHDCEMNVPYHQGSFMLFRTSCFEQVGLFDERFFMYPEDIDLTRRMHSKFRTMYYPYVSVIHDHRAASYKSAKMLYIHIVNMIRYFNKWGWIFDKERSRVNKQLWADLKK